MFTTVTELSFADNEKDTMRYFALACDYDGTIATAGSVDDATISSIEKIKSSGRKLILVTGRQLDDLQRVFSRLELFDMVVAENGALLYQPEGRKERILRDPPPEKLVMTLRSRGITPLSIGKVIVATWEPHQNTVLEVIRDLGLELQVIFNKGAVMVLPSGVNKASGLREALTVLGLSPHNVVGVGDAENDHAFLEVCECAAVVANALPSLKEKCDYIAAHDHGAGVQEIIERIVDNDLEDIGSRLTRHNLSLGRVSDRSELRLPSYGISVMLTGTSGGGKTTLASSVIEQLSTGKYQFCIFDPEGDYEHLPGVIVLGSTKRPPTEQEVLDVLQNPDSNCAVNMISIALDKRPAFFEGLLSNLLDLRVKTGRPHWLIIDESHHLMPATWKPATSSAQPDLRGTLFITVNPHHMAKSLVMETDLVIVIGKSPHQTFQMFSSAIDQPTPIVPAGDLPQGEAFAWWRKTNSDPIRFQSIPPTIERHRHIRKYAEGELSPDVSFYFKGPEGKLNLRAQNLYIFLQLADGVDDETWLFHLKAGDYSKWFEERIKDEELADLTREIEHGPSADPQLSRRLIREKIEERYTLPT